MTEKIENSTDERRNNCLLLSCLGKTYGVGGTLYKYMTQKIENSTNPSRQSRRRRLMNEAVTGFEMEVENKGELNMKEQHNQFRYLHSADETDVKIFPRDNVYDVQLLADGQNVICSYQTTSEDEAKDIKSELKTRYETNNQRVN